MEYMNYSNDKLRKLFSDKSDSLAVANKRRDALGPEVAGIEYELSRRREVALGKFTGVRVYESGDYCGMKAGRYAFYYGYEAQMCLKHDNCTCEDKEWCFTASIDGKEVMRIPESKLGQQTRTLNLLRGIGQFLSREVG